MDGQRFDDIVRDLAGRVSRRGFAKAVLGAAGGALLTRAGIGDAAARNGICKRDRECSGSTPRCETTSGICCAVRDGLQNHTCCRPDQVEAETSLVIEGTFYQCCPAGSDRLGLGGTPGRPRCCAEGTTCRAADKCCKPGDVCADGDDGAKGRCCHAGSASDLCNGKCCADGGVCASGNGRKICCPADSHLELVNGKCCSADGVIAVDARDGRRACCPAGSKSQLVNGKCCAEENVLVEDDGKTVCCPAGSQNQLADGKCCSQDNVIAFGDRGRESCCAPGSSTSLCGTKCCAEGHACCDGRCCPTCGGSCNEDGTCNDCPDESFICGDQCCPQGRKCCDRVCCADGVECDGPGGTCGGACEETFDVVISGNAGGSAPIDVDDNFDVSVNGGQVVSTTGLSGAKGPFSFAVSNGDTIRLVGRDTAGFCASIGPTYLFRSCDSTSQTLDAAGLNLGCGRPSGDQGDFYDKTYTVSFS